MLRIALLGVLILVNGFAHAAEPCYKNYDASKCIPKLKQAQQRLNKVYASHEKAVLKMLGNEEGSDYDAYYKKLLVDGLRKTNRAREVYEDSACFSDQLADGMSLRDSDVIALECKIEWRERVAKELNDKIRVITPLVEPGR